MSDESSMGGNSAAQSIHPASLKPMSLGCILPVMLAVVVVGLAYMGLQKIVEHTGPWALQAADHALVESGIPEAQRKPFAAEVARLRAAFEAETLDASAVVNGVAGLLESPTLPLLIVHDVVDRRLPASGLTAEQKSAFMASITEFKAAADSKKLKYQDLIKVLGPLARTEEQGGPKETLTDAELMEMAKRADAMTSVVEVPKLDVEPTHAVLLKRFQDHVDSVLAGDAEKVERSQ